MRLFRLCPKIRVCAPAKLKDGRTLTIPTHNVELSDHCDRFIADCIAAGRFSDISEVVREALRLLEEREREDEAKLELLRAAAKEGFDEIDRGDYVTLRSDREIEDFVRQIGKEVSAELATEPDRG
jgi:antitoxin ParD1/3/4